MPTKLPEPGDAQVLYVVNLSGYVFRAYHAIAPLSNSKGEPTHATFGVTNMLMSLVRNQRPARLAVAMDSRTPTFRKTEIYPEYKANRPPPPPDLAQQMARCRDMAEAFAIPVFQCDGFEADNLIAACVKRSREHGLHVVIASGDKDLMQLVASDVTMWDAMRQRVYGPDEVREKWGVGPEQICDLLSLMGDASDNIPGVPHVGEKTAAKLIQEHGSLAGVYQHLASIKGKLKEYLTDHEADALLSKRLVCLRDEVPLQLDLEALRYGGYDHARLRALFGELEFGSLLKSLEVAAPAPVPENTVQEAPSAAGSYETILTVDELDAAVAACRANGWFAVDTETTSLDAWRARLVGISLSWRPRQGVYVPVGHQPRMGDPRQLPLAVVLERLRPLLADPAVRKAGQNIKYDDIVLRCAGAPVAGYEFDTMIASYLIDPERHTHRLDEIARTELQYEMVSFDQVTKAGRNKQMTFDQVPIAEATRYSAEDADMVSRLVERLRPRVEGDQLLGLMRDVEVPLALVLGRMEEHGVLLDVAHLKRLSAQLSVDIARLDQECQALAGHSFNVNAPRQLETILFDELKLPVLKRTKTSRSTDAEVLEELGQQHELPRRILELRSLTKLVGTYLDALPALVDPATGRVHTSYNQAVAATGRLSSSNPNLQNIPVRTPLGREIREAFVAPPGQRLLSADYSQIELRVLAHLSHDPILVDAFRRGEDVHARTAMEIFKVPAGEVTKEMRARAKTTNFAVIYGQGESALARQLNITREDAADFIKRYFETFATLRAYMDQVVERARAGEGVRTLLGRRRFLADLASTNRALRMAAERMATNTPIQGTAADLIKLAMVEIDRRLHDRRLGARMVLTVHDELVFEVPEAESDVVEGLVREVMEGVFPLDVPLVVDRGWGATWGAAH